MVSPFRVTGVEELRRLVHGGDEAHGETAQTCESSMPLPMDPQPPARRKGRKRMAIAKESALPERRGRHMTG
eukprot:4582614-Pyramimonas_sp.AAC.1